MAISKVNPTGTKSKTSQNNGTKKNAFPGTRMKTGTAVEGINYTISPLYTPKPKFNTTADRLRKQLAKK